MFIQVSTMQNHKILRWKLTSFILKVELGAGIAFVVEIFRKGFMVFFCCSSSRCFFVGEPLWKKSSSDLIDSTYKKIHCFYRKRLSLHPSDLLFT